MKLYCSLSKKLNLNLDMSVSDAKYTLKASDIVNRITMNCLGVIVPRLSEFSGLILMGLRGAHAF